VTAGRTGHAAAALAGAVAGGVLMLATSGFSIEQGPRPGRAEPEPRATVDASGARTTDAYVAWSPAGLPPAAAAAARSVPGVLRVTKVRAGLEWITATRGRDGSFTRTLPKGYVIPWEVAMIRPREYAHFVPASERAAVLALRPREALLAHSSAQLRGDVTEITVRDGTVPVAGVVADDTTNGYEAIIRGRAPKSWARVDEFLLIAGPKIDRAILTRRLRRVLDPGAGLVVRARGENPFLRYGDAVLPQLLIKKEFGEFSARPRPDGFLDIDPAWRRAHIRERRVPLLGEITCHDSVFPQLRAALREIVEENLAHLIDGGDYGGCFSPRFINTNPDGRLSHHAWGIAFDVNVSENGFGTEPDLDPGIVTHLEDWGFTWGGRWLVPDGMHFEWTSFP